MPTFVLPLMLLAVIASGTSAAQGLRQFPDVTSYLGFVVPGTIIQGTLLAGLTTGIALAGDIEGGSSTACSSPPFTARASSSGVLRPQSASPPCKSRSFWG